MGRYQSRVLITEPRIKLLGIWTIVVYLGFLHIHILCAGGH